jgi:murein DD-endopeptidase MepM/ murein hydrolase activator NlpD
MKQILIAIILILTSCQTTSKPFEFRPPLSKGKITSNLGGRWGRLHLGVDIGAPKWTPVKTTARGQVVGIMRKDRIFGNRVDVYHSDIGLYSSYSHLEEIHVEMTQRLNDGDLIGLVGSTGKSTGAHLHFEIYNANGVYVNPLGLINQHNFTFRNK